MPAGGLFWLRVIGESCRVTFWVRQYGGQFGTLAHFWESFKRRRLRVPRADRFLTSIHLTLHCFTSLSCVICLRSDRWTMLDDHGLNGIAICDDAPGKRAEWTVERGGDLRIEVGSLLVAHHFVERIDQVAGLEQRWDIVRHPGCDRCRIPRYLIAFYCHKPRNVACPGDLPYLPGRIR